MLKPLERICDTVKCVVRRKNVEKEGILILTSARVLFKADNEIDVQFLRQNLIVNRKERPGEYWVLQLMDGNNKQQVDYFRFYG
jgi:hypothetical protein